MHVVTFVGSGGDVGALVASGGGEVPAVTGTDGGFSKSGGVGGGADIAGDNGGASEGDTVGALLAGVVGTFVDADGCVQ